MTEPVKILTFIYIIFVVLLILSGTLGTLLGEIIYYMSFLVPVAIGFYSSRKLKYKREEIAGVAEAPDSILSLDGKDIRRIIPLIFPTVTVIFLISLATTLVLSLFGVSSPVVENDNIVRMLILHALVPSILEETLFRYIPMKLLLPYSKRWCIIYSAFCFALIHCSFSQMPYAFAAGIIFMAIDVCVGSIWPSVILHFMNNSISVIWIKYCSGMTASIIFVSVLVTLTAVSLIFVYKSRNKYKELTNDLFDKGDGFEVTYAPIALALITFYIAAMNLYK